VGANRHPDASDETLLRVADPGLAKHGAGAARRR